MADTGFDEDTILDLSDLAPPRQRVRLAGDRIFTLASPHEFGAVEQARLEAIQRKIKKLAQRMQPERSRELSQLFEDVVKLILIDVDTDDLKSLTDQEKQALSMVFTARWAEYMRSLQERTGTPMSLVDDDTILES